MISSAKKYPEQAQVSNRILMGTSIEGDLHSDGDVRIDGKVKGTVKITGKLVVGEHGVVEGEVECKNAAVAGTVEGTFKIAQTLSIAQSGKVSGEIHTEKLSVEPGAELNGSVTMGTAVMRKVSKEEDNNAKTA
jgi:cytoskeletal protein CcmA (bactofilin family)